MSSLKFARDVIRAELQHAKQGLAYYEQRVQQLESALQQVDSLNGPGKTRTAPNTTEKKGRARKQGKGKLQVKASQSSSGRDGSALPKTGGEFWMRLVSKKPKSAVDIANAAAAALKLDPENDQDLIRVLKSRVAPALQNLVNAKRVQDQGTGRERRFFVA